MVEDMGGNMTFLVDLLQQQHNENTRQTLAQPKYADIEIE